MMNEADKWIKIQNFFKENFTHGEIPDLDTMLFLIGVQELGMGKIKLKKDDKLNVIHIGVCRLLEPFGYYKFEGADKDEWPIYSLVEKLPNLKPNEQSLLMKKAIIKYFDEESILN